MTLGRRQRVGPQRRLQFPEAVRKEQGIVDILEMFKGVDTGNQTPYMLQIRKVLHPLHSPSALMERLTRKAKPMSADEATAPTPSPNRVLRPVLES